ncbi:hypothetical protein PTKIN_Ptkin06aG0193300 [Pterospermum kingtungense]
MASATTRLTFSFHHLTQQPSPKPPPQKPLLFISPKLLPTISLNNTVIKPHKRQLHFTTIHSIDVSKEDSQGTPTPVPDHEKQVPPPPASAAEVVVEEKFDKRRLEEKFAVLNTGIYECRS